MIYYLKYLVTFYEYGDHIYKNAQSYKPSHNLILPQRIINESAVMTTLLRIYSMYDGALYGKAFSIFLCHSISIHLIPVFTFSLLCLVYCLLVGFSISVLIFSMLFCLTASFFVCSQRNPAIIHIYYIKLNYWIQMEMQ